MVDRARYYNRSIRCWTSRKHLCADHCTGEKRQKDSPWNIRDVSGSGGFGFVVF